YSAWLSWVAQDRQRKAVFLARLQQLTTATQSEVREQAAQVIAAYGYIYPPVRKTVASVLVDMICRKENISIQRELLSLSMYPNYSSAEQENVAAACVLSTGDIDVEMATRLASYAHLDTPLTSQICQIWLAADTTWGMSSRNLIRWCLD